MCERVQDFLFPAVLTKSLQVVDLSGGLESDSDGEIPNSKRTPRDRSKRQRMTYDEDDSPGLDQEDTQVPILPNSAAVHIAVPQMTGNHGMLVKLSFSVSFLLLRPIQDLL